MSNLYSERLIAVNLEADSKDSAIEQLICMLDKENRINSLSEFRDSIYERENESTTEVGEYTAIPHGRSETVIENSVCIATLKKPVIWNFETKEEIDIIFMLAVKKDSSDTHIEILSELASKIMEEDFISNIKNSDSKNEIYKIITEKEDSK
ncbi:EIIBCA-Man [Sebaldella termitidis]|uniref:PTS IIA-like nitrogen-regulatory protein PtsN n=1 Tax=Sebaldella termitidis (strain ATCC 33386 / NCTC 11300) TaxID=526218 RepID=D1AHT7_SEBTE|nr:PTS sugar transporter subunit IIA [Sebaldella termitidis]ACZ08321.1 putative PTS IIA-like nitrogen-regulatory protein PtsN [Sebaldella termitidis ATCC 33386]SUI23630.1 EIIBCA-Man [Sebaldella termitidis]